MISSHSLALEGSRKFYTILGVYTVLVLHSSLPNPPDKQDLFGQLPGLLQSKQPPTSTVHHGFRFRSLGSLGETC